MEERFCRKCGGSYCISDDKRGRKRSMCYVCSPPTPSVHRPKMISRIKQPLPPPIKPKLPKPKPIISKPEIPGTVYTITITPWSKLRPVEVFKLYTRIEADKCVDLYTRFGEHVAMDVYRPKPKKEEKPAVKHDNLEWAVPTVEHTWTAESDKIDQLAVQYSDSTENP